MSLSTETRLSRAVNGVSDIQAHKLAKTQDEIVKSLDRHFLFPINYRYDYLNGLASIFGQLAPPVQPKDLHNRFTNLSDNAIELFPSSAGFPHRTALGNPKQNKHWGHSLAVGLDSIKLFAEDDSFPKTLESGVTLAQVASKMYHKAADDFLRHFIYMLPHADEDRAALVEVVCAWVVVFDDFQEQAEDHEVPALQQAFLASLMGTHGQGTSNTALQNAMNDTVRSLRRLGDTGGEEVLQATIDFITLPRPEKSHFENLKEFLEWRREDAAVRFTLACVKFSLNSKVDILSPRLAKLYQLFSDHIVYINDLASYDKEKAAYNRQVPSTRVGALYSDLGSCAWSFAAFIDCSRIQTADLMLFTRGEVKLFANIVEMIRTLLSLPTDGQGAKALAYGLQLQVESDIYAEMERLKDDLQDDEWRVVYGWLDESSGHCCVSHMLRRYGGEGCRMAQPICR